MPIRQRTDEPQKYDTVHDLGHGFLKLLHCNPITTAKESIFHTRVAQ
jgi:hypothetical protein